MNPKAFQLLLPILTLLLLLLQKTLSSVNPNYVACKPFECGSLSISYPFFVVDKQPSFCGSEGFGVSCNPQNKTIIELSYDDYIINSISYQDLSISVTNSAFSNSVFGCLSSVHHLTLSPQNKFNFTTYEHKQLVLLENCSTNISSSKGYEAIKCKEDESDHTLFAVYKDDFKQEEVGECNNTVFVSYDGKENDRIGGIQGLLRQGIILEYITNNCSTCQNSGGRCGMSQHTSEFFAFALIGITEVRAINPKSARARMDTKLDDRHSQVCIEDDKKTAYSPYNNHDQPPKALCPPPPECSPKNISFSVQYNISTQCQGCLDKGRWCDDDTYGRGFACRSRNKGKHLGIILGTGGLIIIIIIIILGLIAYCHWRQRKNKSCSSTMPSRSISFTHVRLDLEVGSMNGVTVFSYTELEEATNNFDPTKQLGEGGFGVVYHGKLRDGREVAVKRLYEKSYKRIEQFKNEIRILTDLRHQNLVTLYGCTSRHTRELLLVYEYIPNGTVADHLHGEQAESKLLPWSTRISISIEIATALSYLHFKDIIHRDVKTNNILLDNSFSVKVADFGLSRLFPADVTHVSTAPQGTPGYVDPEYYQCYQLTDKSDVYSFGVLLIELISSLPAVDVGRERHEINLSNYAMNRIQSSALSELVDPKLGFGTDFKVRRMITLVAELAYQCLQHEREHRPSMEEVKETLTKIASEDYDAIEAEESEMSAQTKHIPKPPPPPMDSDLELMRNNRQQPPPSPVSVMDKWLNSSKSSTPNTSRSS